MKGERMAKRSSIGSMVRKRLSDITNSQSQPRLPALEEKQQQQQQQQPQIPESSEDLINQLLKEKSTLVKLIEERNKIIELSGNELRNLRMNYQKLQMQNWNLAQSNTQILAELNLGRDKVKALQHELVCKDALLKAKYLEKEGKMDMKCQAMGPPQEGKEASEECLNKEGRHMRPCNRSRRRTARSQSMGPSSTNRQTIDKEKAENKRRCLRRQSARFRSQERESANNLFEIEDVKLPASAASQPMQGDEDGRPTPNVPRSSSSSSSSSLSQHRSSIGRPLRRAVEKVQSYKEQPVNVKMRRAE